MTRRLTIDDFVAKARLVHGSRYDYSGATYVNSTTKITIGCEVHGPFEQTPSNHLTGFGCRKCGLLNAGQYHKKDTAKFIEKARAMHGERYDYSRTVYRGAREDVTIICRKHGEYQQNASIHLNSKRGRETSAGCPACSYEERAERQRMTLAEFLQRAADAHGRTYDYRLVESTYESAASTVSIICPDHGVFQKLAANHIAGQGCPVCAWARTGDKHRKSTEAFIGEAHRVHEHRYDYSLVDYQGAFKRVSIICPIDGPFAQSPTSHLRGIGCPKCSRRAQGAPRNLTRALRGEFDDGRDAFVYMLTFDLPGLDTTLYKVGCGTGSRVRTLGNDIKRVGGRIRDQRLWHYASTAQAIVVEQLAHQQVAAHQYVIPPHLKFPGYSEVFSQAPDVAAAEVHEVFIRFVEGQRKIQAASAQQELDLVVANECAP